MIRVQAHAFDTAAELAKLKQGRRDIGGCVIFVGTMRELNEGAEVSAMTLEHYPGMTETELERVETLAHARWPLQATLIVHRIGALAPGDPIVLVIAASAHRLAAFEAAQFLMDYLKTSAPFWKKETGADGSGTWVDAREADTAAHARWAD